jgi:polysaccharide deacetylase family protein (PEP-CTERM system associated)
MKKNKSILLTIDVEDWFQVENFKQWIPFSSWSTCELRVEQNTHRLLDLFDSFVSTRNPKPGTRNQITTTFFILGWIAERLPDLVREIHSRGHEVASHGYNHNLCSQQTSEDLKKDLSDSKKLLEDIIGGPVFGYRSPSFSISADILKNIEDCGYLYDSSFNSFGMHNRYGWVDLSNGEKQGIIIQNPAYRTQKLEPCTKHQASNTFYELPISNLTIANRILPWGGGGYFRMIPFLLFKMGVKSILLREEAYLFYLHPWEIDSDQPKVKKAHPFYKFRHYINLSRTHSKLEKFLRAFQQHRFVTCKQYIDGLLE